MEHVARFKFVERVAFEKHVTVCSTDFLASARVMYLSELRRCRQGDDLVRVLFVCVLSNGLPKFRRVRAVEYFLSGIQETYGFFDIESLKFFLMNHKGSIRCAKEDCKFVWGDSSLWRHWLSLRGLVSTLSVHNVSNISGLRSLGKNQVRDDRSRGKFISEYLQLPVF